MILCDIVKQVNDLENDMMNKGMGIRIPEKLKNFLFSTITELEIVSLSTIGLTALTHTFIPLLITRISSIVISWDLVYIVSFIITGLFSLIFITVIVMIPVYAIVHALTNKPMGILKEGYFVLYELSLAMTALLATMQSLTVASASYTTFSIWQIINTILPYIVLTRVLFAIRLLKLPTIAHTFYNEMQIARPVLIGTLCTAIMLYELFFYFNASTIYSILYAHILTVAGMNVVNAIYNTYYRVPRQKM